MGKEEERFSSQDNQEVVADIVAEVNQLLEGKGSKLAKVDGATMIITTQELLPETAEFNQADFTVEVWEVYSPRPGITRVNQKLYGFFGNGQRIKKRSMGGAFRFQRLPYYQDIPMLGYTAIREIPAEIKPTEADLQDLLKKIRKAKQELPPAI